MLEYGCFDAVVAGAGVVLGAGVGEIIVAGGGDRIRGGTTG